MGPEELRFRAHVAFKTARNVLQNLEQVTNRRKVFIYLSNGYDFNPFVATRARDPNDPLSVGPEYDDFDQDSDSNIYNRLPNPQIDPFRTGLTFADVDLTTDLAELARAANRANTSFYTFDPRGLIAGPDIDVDVDLRDWNTFVFKSQSSCGCWRS